MNDWTLTWVKGSNVAVLVTALVQLRDRVTPLRNGADIGVTLIGRLLSNTDKDGGGEPTRKLD